MTYGRAVGRRLARLALVAAFAVPSGAAVAGGPAHAASPWVVGAQATADRTLTASKPQFSMTRTVEPQDVAPWFTTRLKMRLSFASQASRQGSARVIAAVNRQPAALITLRTQDDGMRIFYDGYLSGPVTIVTTDSSIEIDYANYPRADAIRAGANTFQVALQDADGLVEKAEIDPLTGFSATTIAPEQLSIALPTEIAARVGERFTVPYEVVSRAERPDQPLRVSVEKAGGPLELDREQDDHSSTGTKRAGQFTGTAGAPGRYQLRLSANGGYNPVSGVVLVEVRPAERQGPGPAAVAVAVGLVTVAMVLFAGGRWRTRRGPDRMTP